MSTPCCGDFDLEPERIRCLQESGITLNFLQAQIKRNPEALTPPALTTLSAADATKICKTKRPVCECRDDCTRRNGSEKKRKAQFVAGLAAEDSSGGTLRKGGKHCNLQRKRPRSKRPGPRHFQFLWASRRSIWSFRFSYSSRRAASASSARLRRNAKNCGD